MIFHWQPRDTGKTTQWLTMGNISLDRVYKIFIMPDELEPDDDEYWLLDDTGDASMIYMCVPGDFTIIQDAIVEKIDVKDFLALS